MPCYFPLTGYKSATTNQNGKRPLSFGTAGFRDLEVTVPCGQCIGCRLERSRQWAVRLMHERQCHDLAIFVTLTYDPANIPRGGTLVKKHHQDFLKRLRKKHEPKKLKFFHCGEYGETLGRPHYHTILFGIDFPDKTRYKKTDQGDMLFTSDTLDQLWGHGQCFIGTVTFKSARYVAAYCLKKVNGDRALEHYSRPDPDTGEIIQLQPEYSTQSKGLGLEWLHRYTSDVFPVDSVVCEGRESSVPRYYRKKLAEHDAKNLPAQRGRSLSQRLTDNRIKAAKKRSPDNTPERLAVKHTVRLSKISQLKRSL